MNVFIRYEENGDLWTLNSTYKSKDCISLSLKDT